MVIDSLKRSAKKIDLDLFGRSLEKEAIVSKIEIELPILNRDFPDLPKVEIAFNFPDSRF